MLRDEYGRKIDYLRISVTDRCNLRCIYCMPEGGIKPRNPEDILTFEEIKKVVKAAVSLGINRVRITGGEPLIRRELIRLIGFLGTLVEDLSLTTNGMLLGRYAYQLREKGLKRVNISLDSLEEGRYRAITRGGDLGEVLRGIDKALEAGLHPVKVNMVVIRGINDREIIDFVRFVADRPLSVRFIEFMPSSGWSEKRFIPMVEVKRRCEQFFALHPTEEIGAGPAKYYSIENFPGRIGFISSLSLKFCSRCNRLRLTSDGRLKPCLHGAGDNINLKEAIRGGATPEELTLLLKMAAYGKPDQHHLESVPPTPSEETMCQIGG